ncbi:hypothetical protein GR167_14865 [Rhodobacteraceae bacterium GS-10]|uniref:Chemoreceptor zinc-binding domain-containing protein n=2 Tax=Thalassovita mangrovi TaxID=2692236 RepID=A0A6L8LKK8_9RHOB|nr:hypothetical protein [Thalassovita mangrovi]
MQTMTAITLRGELDDALFAHIDWKYGLREAAVYRDTGLPVEEIESCDCCKFGHWMQSLPGFLRVTPEAREVDRLHREFHACAGKIARRISNCEFDAAISDLSGRQYNALSAKLTKAVARWKLAVS